MTPLRQRFVDELRLRNRAPRTIETYVAHVARFSRFANRSPDLLGTDDVKAFQLHLLEARVSWSLFNQALCALRFLYRHVLGRPGVVEQVPFGKRPRTLPTILSPHEVGRLLQRMADEAMRALSVPDAGATAAVQMLGHKADLMFICFRRGFAQLAQAQLALSRTELHGYPETTTSYVSKRVTYRCSIWKQNAWMVPT